MSVYVWLRLVRQVSFVWISILFVIMVNILQRPVFAGELSGSVELGIQEYKTSSSGRKEVKTVDKTQRYNLDYEDYLYRPWLADYHVGGTFSLTDIDRDSQKSETKLTSYRINSKLFPYSPFPLSLYIIENETDIEIQSNPDTTIDSRLYGADLKLDFYTLPTTNLFYYGQTTLSNLSSVLSEQDSATAGINMFKRWEDLTANIRYENSDYSEKYTARSASADRLTSSFVYRPSDTLQASFVHTDYQRNSDKPETVIFDPLYSDRESKSHNFSMLWTPQERMNLSIYANYFLEDYEESHREAKDGQANLDYQITDHLSAFGSAYELSTELNGEKYDSHDKRIGLAYSKAELFGNLELQGRMNGGYFNRTTETSVETKEKNDYFYLVGGRVEYNIQLGNLMVSPYYDINYSYNQQTKIHATKNTQHDTGLRLDGVIARGRVNGSVSYTVLDQENDLSIRSEQFRSYLSYEHRVFVRATIRLQAGASYTKGRIEDNTFESFTQTEDTETQTTYTRLDYTTPVLGSGILFQGSYRYEKRTTQSGFKEQNNLVDARFTHQFGKLFTEAGFMRKESVIDNIDSRDSIWFLKVRRDFSFGSK